MRYQVWDLVSGMVMLPWNRDLFLAYEMRDQKQADSLAAGLDLNLARYAVRGGIGKKIAD